MAYEIPPGTIFTSDQNPDEVTGIRLPLTPEEWFLCCARRDGGDSYYVGGCCGNLSQAQDILNHMMRMNSEGMSAYDIRHHLAEFHDLVRNHDGWNTKDMPNLADFAEKDPIARILMVYEAVKDRVQPGRGDMPYAAPYDPTSVEQALRTVETHASSLSRSFFWIRPPADEKPSHMDQTWRVERIRLLLPAIKTLAAYLETLHLGDFEGWCIIDHTGIPCQARGGPAVFGTKKEAQSTLKDWTKTIGEDRKRVRAGEDIPAHLQREFEMRRCTVSLERGLFVHDPE